MAYELKDNSGSIFKNDKREKDTHPHGTGKALIGGVLYYVSAWTKEGAKGKFQSLSFKPANGDASPGVAPRTTYGADHADTDEVPF